MKIIVQTGRTSKRDRIFIGDATVTTGAGKTGLTNSSLTAYYFRDGDSSATSISLSAGTVGTWSSGGFKEIDATNMPGWYEVGIPNAVFANTVDAAEVMYKGTNLVPVNLEYQLVPWNPQDGVRLGTTALPNAAAGASGGLPTGDSSGRVTPVPSTIPTTTQIATVILDTPGVPLATDGAGHVNAAAVLGAVGSVAGNVGGSVAGSVSGSVVGSVGSVTTPVTLDLTQAVPRSNTAETVGDSLHASRASGFGKLVVNTSALTEALYESDNTTIAKQWNIDSATAPTQRT